MSALAQLLVMPALLGSALIGGVFFAFSSFVMKALARAPSPQGMTAMQNINIVVINPWFLGAFMGTAALSVGLAAFSVLHWGQPAAVFYLSAAMAYLIGTFLVTLLGNVPLNNRLAACAPDDPASVVEWERYLQVWTRWNHVRTVAAMLAVLLFVLGLMRSGQA